MPNLIPMDAETEALAAACVADPDDESARLRFAAHLRRAGCPEAAAAIAGPSGRSYASFAALHAVRLGPVLELEVGMCLTPQTVTQSHITAMVEAFKWRNADATAIRKDVRQYVEALIAWAEALADVAEAIAEEAYGLDLPERVATALRDLAGDIRHFPRTGAELIARLGTGEPG